MISIADRSARRPCPDGALGLAACGSDDEPTPTAGGAGGAGGDLACSTGQRHRRRVQRPEERHGRVDQGLPAACAGRDDQLPAGRLRRGHPGVPRRHRRLRRLRLRPQGRRAAAGRRAVRRRQGAQPADGDRPDRGRLQPRGRGRPRRSTPPPSPRSSPARSPSGTTRPSTADQRGRRAARTPDPDGAPLRRVRHHRQLHQVPRGGRPEAWTFGNGQGLEGPRRHRRREVGRASPPASRAPRARSRYVELSFAENGGLKTAKIANGAGESVELTAENAGKTVEAAKVEGHRRRPDAGARLRHQGRRAPTRSSW